MKKYLEDLKKELSKRKFKKHEIEDILNDYQEMIDQGISEGLSEEELEKKFGSPEKVARELSDDYEPSKEEKIDEEEFKLWKTFDSKDKSLNIHIKIIDDDVIIKATSDEKISIYYQGDFDEDRYELTFDEQNLKLSAPPFKGFKFNHFLKSNKETTFMILIPEDQLIELFNYSVVNSDLMIEDVKANTFNLSTTNGDVDIHSSYLGNFKISTVNGDLKCKNIYVDSIHSTQVSGDIKMIDSTINKELKMNSVSGDITFNHTTCNTLDCSTVSGDIKGNEFYPKVINFKTISGDIHLKNEHKEHIEINKKAPFTGKVKIDV